MSQRIENAPRFADCLGYVENWEALDALLDSTTQEPATRDNLRDYVVSRKIFANGLTVARIPRGYQHNVR